MMGRIMTTKNILWLGNHRNRCFASFHKGFRPIFSAIQPENPENISIIVYLFGLYLIVSGLLIVLGKKLKVTSIILAYVLILF